ncbi:DNA-directed RNA polymerase subunit omega [Wansuia hejianensis]|uniref:DNA-directed RNA polymerase subunit omega n=1 Tax=Wansuia hejianensis TaxID=2763667 RepID=A0A926EZD6_9FIRM|nr:DNA-directed RNA polymerase subunit omega [Wansuia hejianensis]MBC8590451.1 DNA-directed RNA polymerase subunit omega [Wansuia hejianensis]
MLNPSFKGVLKEGDSRYTLVMLTAKRARQIVDNNPILIDTDSTKPVSIAIEEIVEGKITYKNPSINTIK